MSILPRADSSDNDMHCGNLHGISRPILVKLTSYQAAYVISDPRLRLKPQKTVLSVKKSRRRDVSINVLVPAYTLVIPRIPSATR